MLNYSSSSNFLRLKQQCTEQSLNSQEARGMKVQGTTHSFVLVSEAAKIKVHQSYGHLSPPILTMQSTFTHPLKTLQPTRSAEPVAFCLKKWGAGAQVAMSGIEREREGGHISLRTEGQGDASGWGGWDAPLRLAIRWEKKAPWDRRRRLPVQGWGQRRVQSSTKGRRHITGKPVRA